MTSLTLPAQCRALGFEPVMTVRVSRSDAPGSSRYLMAMSRHAGAMGGRPSARLGTRQDAVTGHAAALGCQVEHGFGIFRRGRLNGQRQRWTAQRRQESGHAIQFPCRPRQHMPSAHGGKMPVAPRPPSAQLLRERRRAGRYRCPSLRRSPSRRACRAWPVGVHHCGDVARALGLVGHRDDGGERHPRRGRAPAAESIEVNTMRACGTTSRKQPGLSLVPPSGPRMKVWKAPPGRRSKARTSVVQGRGHHHSFSSLGSAQACHSVARGAAPGAR